MKDCKKKLKIKHDPEKNRERNRGWRMGDINEMGIIEMTMR